MIHITIAADGISPLFAPLLVFPSRHNHKYEKNVNVLFVENSDNSQRFLSESGGSRTRFAIIPNIISLTSSISTAVRHRGVPLSFVPPILANRQALLLSYELNILCTLA